MNAIGSQTRRKGVPSIVESEIHEPRAFASIPPAGLDRIDVDARARVAEHKLLWSSILLEHHQFLKDDVVHRNGSSPAGLTSGDENCPSEKVHVSHCKPRISPRRIPVLRAMVTTERM